MLWIQAWIINTYVYVYVYDPWSKGVALARETINPAHAFKICEHEFYREIWIDGLEVLI